MSITVLTVKAEVICANTELISERNTKYAGIGIREDHPDILVSPHWGGQFWVNNINPEPQYYTSNAPIAGYREPVYNVVSPNGSQAPVGGRYRPYSDDWMNPNVVLVAVKTGGYPRLYFASNIIRKLVAKGDDIYDHYYISSEKYDYMKHGWIMLNNVFVDPSDDTAVDWARYRLRGWTGRIYDWFVSWYY